MKLFESFLDRFFHCKEKNCEITRFLWSVFITFYMSKDYHFKYIKLSLNKRVKLTLKLSIICHNEMFKFTQGSFQVRYIPKYLDSI